MAKTARYRRWTADTEIAFLLALRLTGSVARACAEIGRSTHGAQDRRKRMPDFAARWQAILDEWQAAQATERRAATGADDPGVMPNRVRYDGFTPVRQRAFLRALTETGSVAQACERVGISQAAATKARRTWRSFSDAWDRAETHCEADLEQIAVERAIAGIEQAVFHAGKQVATRTVFSDPLMRKMIDVRERRGRMAAEAKAVERPHYATKAETDAVLLQKLAALEVRVERDRAEADAAAWRRWIDEWGAFGGDLARARTLQPGSTPDQEVLPPLRDARDGAKLRMV